MTDWFSKSTLAKLLDGFADVPDLYPFPDTTLVILLEHFMERVRAEVDDPGVIAMGELMLSKAREKAASEHFR